MGARKLPVRSPAIAVALAVCLVVGAAPAAPHPTGDDDPIVTALEQGWRWNQIQRGLGEPTFSLVTNVDGRLYAADSQGLWCYDGSTWSPRLRTQDLVPNYTAWIGQAEGELVLANGGKLTPIERDGPPIQLHLPDGRGLSRPIRDHRGRLLAGFHRDVVAITADGLQRVASLPDVVGRITALAEDDDGALWCATEKRGIWRGRGDDWQAMPQAPNQHEQANDIALAVSVPGGVLFLPRIFSDRDSGLLWQGERFVTLEMSGAQGQVSDALVTPSGRVLVAVQHSSMLILAPGTEPRWASLDLPFSNDDVVQSMALLDGGRFALVDSRGRLHVNHWESDRWHVHDPTPAISRIVNAIAPAVSGGVWLATHVGIGRFDGSAFVDCHLEAPGIGVNFQHATAIAEDDDGTLWVGSGSAFPGVIRRDAQGWHQDVEITGEHQGVHAYHRAPDGSLWATLLALPGAPANNRGAVLQRVDGRWVRHDTMLDGQPMPRSYALAWSPEGDLYLGHFGGLARWRGAGFHTLPDVGLAADESAFCLAFEPDGTLWLGRGRRRSGVSFRTPTGTWHHPEDAPQDAERRWAAGGAIATTGRGRVWISGELGLFMVVDDQLVRVVTDGVGSMSSFWPVLPESDGSGLWIGSLGSGLAHYQPDDTTPPRTGRVFTEVPDSSRPDNVVVRWSGDDAWGLTPRERLLFSYRFADPSAWTPWSLATSHPAFDIQPGQHSIEVRCMDEAGNIEAPPRVQTFTVERRAPSVWASRPMLAAYAVILAALAALVVGHQLRQRDRLREAAERQRLGNDLRELTRRLMTTQEDERQRLARDLHDDLGQLLTLAGLQIDLADKLPDKPERRHEVLDRARDSTRRAMDSVRNLAAQIRPTVLDDHGLESALRTTLEDLSRSTGLSVSSELRCRAGELPQQVETHAFRILNESLTNVVRHAQADRVHVELIMDGHDLAILVQDDGIGFDVGAPSARHGVGLLSMRERAEALGGSFHIEPTPTGGTRLSARLPLPHRSPPEKPSPW